MALTPKVPNHVATPDTGKRKRVEIDLTGDDSDGLVAPVHPAKQSRQSSRPSASSRSIHRSTSGAALNTPPASNTQSRYDSVYFPSSSAPINGMHSEQERQAWLAEGEEDIDEIIGSTQDAASGTDELTLYGNLDTKIVGCQYYRGFASRGEVILTRREPGNPYDSNAIRIDNVNAQQIGHIPKRVAEKLARYMDNRWLHLEGQLAGEIGTYDCPLTVKMYGPDPRSDAGRQIQERMKGDKLPIKALQEAERAEKQREKERQEAVKRQRIEENKRKAMALRAARMGKGGAAPSSSQEPQWSSQSQAGLEPAKAPVMADIIEASQRFNPREIGQTADQYGMQEEMLKNMPMSPKPDAIKTEMLPYQRQALHWLLSQETPSLPGTSDTETVQLWKKHPQKPNAYTNLATSFSVQGDPPLASGGILADDMGLGKTLEMISLLVADNEKAGEKTGTTLIISPLSVMSNWSDQIARHVHESHALQVYTYHGAGRVKMQAADFAQYDVVITTYQTLASDFMPRGKGTQKAKEDGLRSSGLYSMDWRRIILDEGHTVRNPSSKGAAACKAVKARSRWVLTGTPIVNNLKDLFTLLRFVGIRGGLEQLEVFNSVLVRPLKASSPDAVALLQAVMAAFTLRRKKEMPFIDLKLPSLEEFKHTITFTEKEQSRYDAFQQQAKGQLASFQNNQSSGNKRAQAFQHLLEVLLRMRQCCNHWQLCGERVTQVMEQLEKHGTVALTPDNRKALQDILQLQIESQEDCAICLETLHNPVITTCGHFFGSECIGRVIETQHKCPMCRAELPDDSVLVSPANDCGDESKDDDMELNASSSKLEAMMSILSATKTKGDKTVIFSQWTRFLDIVETRLINEGYKYCRIDGTMSAPKRDAALHALESDDGTTIMLASLGVCAVGLNLVAANQIILSDSWWAPAIEDQAVDRVHRLGQTKECRIFRLVVEGSIEDSVLDIQQEKRKLMRLAFGEKKGKRDQVKSGRLADIQRLLHGAPAAPQSGAA